MRSSRPLALLSRVLFLFPFLPSFFFPSFCLSTSHRASLLFPSFHFYIQSFLYLIPACWLPFIRGTLSIPIHSLINTPIRKRRGNIPSIDCFPSLFFFFISDPQYISLLNSGLIPPIDSNLSKRHLEFHFLNDPSKERLLLASAWINYSWPSSHSLPALRLNPQ